MVVKGRGVARVFATGQRTEIGRIGKVLQRLETENTNLQKQTGRIVRTFGHVHKDWRFLREYPLSDGLLAMSHAWESTDGESLVIAAKGAPEAIADLCHLGEAALSSLRSDVEALASEGLRVIGLTEPDAMITGPELQAMDDDELGRRIGGVSVFARAVPEHKLRIVAAARVGRRSFDNLQKAMTFIFSVHLPIAGMSLLPVMFGMPLALMPVHILFLELIIDPACSVVFEMEEEEKGIMERPPRPASEPLFGKRMILTALVQGLGVLALVATIYALALGAGLGEGEASPFWGSRSSCPS